MKRVLIDLNAFIESQGRWIKNDDVTKQFTIPVKEANYMVYVKEHDDFNMLISPYAFNHMSNKEINRQLTIWLCPKKYLDIDREFELVEYKGRNYHGRISIEIAEGEPHRYYLLCPYRLSGLLTNAEYNIGIQDTFYVELDEVDKYIL